ncbi:hypothetical protein K0M31_018571, partial [Melipona bicolor]
ATALGYTTAGGYDRPCAAAGVRARAPIFPSKHAKSARPVISAGPGLGFASAKNALMDDRSVSNGYVVCGGVGGYTIGCNCLEMGSTTVSSQMELIYTRLRE